MKNPNLVFRIPKNELKDTESFLDAIKKRIIKHEQETGEGIFLRGPESGICIELVHPDFENDNREEELTIHVSYQSYSI